MDAAPRAEHESEAVDLLLDRWPRAVINDRRRVVGKSVGNELKVGPLHLTAMPSRAPTR